MNTRGSTRHHSASSLIKCQQACEFDPRCVAVDWSTANKCWINTNPNHRHNPNARNFGKQYRPTGVSTRTGYAFSASWPGTVMLTIRGIPSEHTEYRPTLLISHSYTSGHHTEAIALNFGMHFAEGYCQYSHRCKILNQSVGVRRSDIPMLPFFAEAGRIIYTVL